MTVRLRPTLIFDADDTIWPCHEYYMAGRDQLATRMHEETGIAHDTAMKVIGAIELGRKAMPEAFLKPSLERSYRSALFTAAFLTGTQYDAERLYGIARECANVVWDAPYPILEGVLEMFDRFRDGGWQVLVATKGDDVEQVKKLTRNNVLTRIDGAYVWPQKTAAHYGKLMAERRIDPELSVMVGDSMESDILPAQAAGIGATVWISNDHAWGAAAGEATHTIPTVLNLPTVIAEDIGLLVYGAR